VRQVQLEGIEVEIVRLPASDLRTGMFVCELDRPWSETPFLFEGFLLENQADIEAVKAQCEYVYIDMGRTEALRIRLDRSHGNTFEDKLRVTSGQDIHAANKVKAETSNVVKTFLDEVRFGKSLDIQIAKSAVAQCVGSILRNPDAMILATQMKEKAHHISAHAFNVCIYSIVIGRLQGMGQKELEKLGACGLLHDIGKIQIPEHIIKKTSILNESEVAIIRQHTTHGRDILMSGRNIYSGAVDVAYNHHECLDGSGYPRGLTEKQINQYCKIVSVADRYDALTSHTPYRIPVNHMDSVNILNTLASSNKIDAQLTSSFVGYLGYYPPGVIVGLNSNEIAIVMNARSKYRLRPKLLVVRDAEGNPVEQFLDLSMKTAGLDGKPYKIIKVHSPGYAGIEPSEYQYSLLQAFD
jgi:HD-GYP domain-containing protein (c-di-GMP phosphodiesterase class II)